MPIKGHEQWGVLVCTQDRAPIWVDSEERLKSLWVQARARGCTPQYVWPHRRSDGTTQMRCWNVGPPRDYDQFLRDAEMEGTSQGHESFHTWNENVSEWANARKFFRVEGEYVTWLM